MTTEPPFLALRTALRALPGVRYIRGYDDVDQWVVTHDGEEVKFRTHKLSDISLSVTSNPRTENNQPAGPNTGDENFMELSRQVRVLQIDITTTGWEQELAENLVAKVLWFTRLVEIAATVDPDLIIYTAEDKDWRKYTYNIRGSNCTYRTLTLPFQAPPKRPISSDKASEYASAAFLQMKKDVARTTMLCQLTFSIARKQGLCLEDPEIPYPSIILLLPTSAYPYKMGWTPATRSLVMPFQTKDGESSPAILPPDLWVELIRIRALLDSATTQAQRQMAKTDLTIPAPLPGINTNLNLA